MKCKRCGLEGYEEDFERIMEDDDKVLCSDCILDVVHVADNAGLIDWQF